MAEWSKALVLGTSHFCGVGSNPTLVNFFFFVNRSILLHSYWNAIKITNYSSLSLLCSIKDLVVAVVIPNAPINVKPHYPPPGLTREFDGDLTFRKIKYSTHRGTTGGQISVTMAGMHFRKLLNSYRLRVENCMSVRSSNDQMPYYWGKYFVQIELKSPTNPLLSPGGG